MRWIEKEPIPKECELCQESDCYNCDTAGERWCLPREEELRVIRKGLVRAVKRMERKIEKIDKELDEIIKQ